MNVNDPNAELRESTALWAAGALPVDEERGLDKVAATDADVAAEKRELEAVIDALAECTRPIDPPPHVKDSLLKRIGRAPRIHIRRAQSARWEEVGEAVSRRILGIDRGRGTVTTLMRMTPGGRLAEHHHHGVEEILVISGDLRLGRESYGPGDYFFAEAGSDHGEITTETGCECLILTGIDH
jgi:anti-sigma factor ChrR (cupin superfamily)